MAPVGMGVADEEEDEEEGEEEGEEEEIEVGEEIEAGAATGEGVVVGAVRGLKVSLILRVNELHSKASYYLILTESPYYLVI